MTKIYGIPNCNTVQKAKAWFMDHDIEYDFHDYKTLGITKEKLQEWCKHFGWENLLNKKGTTWKALSIEEQQQIKTEKKAISFLLKNTSAIKRPIVETGGNYLIRFVEEEYLKAFDKIG